MARRGGKRYTALTGGVGRFYWFSRMRRGKKPAAAATVQFRPLPPSLTPAPPSPSPPSVAAAAQPQPPSTAPSSASAAAQPQPLAPPSPPASPSPSPPPSASVEPQRKKRKKLTLEEIRELPSSGARPFYPRTLLTGTRSIKEPQPWRCIWCQRLNEPKPHLLFALPAFECEGCGAAPSKGDADFGFCFADLGINDACPIGNVKVQKEGECIANALCSCVEITDRMMMTILGEPVSKEGPFIDTDDLLFKYHIKWLEEGNEVQEGYSGYSLMTMLRVFQFEGVKEKSSGVTARDSDSKQKKTTSNESEKLHKISDWKLHDQEDFVALSSALADGYPLPFGFNLGQEIAYLEPGEIYMPPPNDSKDEDGNPPKRHVAVLVGAQQEKHLKFFYFLNCWDESFCSRSKDKGDGIRGGVGAISKDGIKIPFQIFRFNEKRSTQEVQEHYASCGDRH